MKGRELTLDEYCSARHILVDGKLLGHIHEEVEKRILDVIGESHVQILSENFLLSAHMAERSNMILKIEEHTSELQSIMRISYAVFCLKNKKDVLLKTIVAKMMTTHEGQDNRFTIASQ